MPLTLDGDDGISGIDGSAATPAIQGADSNTGITFGTDIVNVVTGGSTRATVDSSGRLLVGTTSALSADTNAFIHTAGPTAGNIILANSSTGALGAGGGVGAVRFFSQSGGAYEEHARIACQADGTTGSGDKPGRIVFYTSADGAASMTEQMKINSLGEFFAYDVYNSTTSSSANVVVASSGRMVRSTSSGKYKTDIETLEDSYADALLNCRPVWYRSTCEGDNPEHGWWGFIAEEVAAIDPRLVHWKTIEVTYDEKGSAVETPCDPEAEGVAYDRFVPHLLNLIKRQKEAIEALETRVAQLEGGAS